MPGLNEALRAVLAAPSPAVRRRRGVCLAGRYRPRNTGRRFSTKARAASWKSSV